MPIEQLCPAGFAVTLFFAHRIHSHIPRHLDSSCPHRDYVNAFHPLRQCLHPARGEAQDGVVQVCCQIKEEKAHSSSPRLPPSLRCLENLLVPLKVCLSRQKSLSKLAATAPHLTSLFWMLKHPTQPVGQRALILRRYKKPCHAILHHLRDAAHIAADDGSASRHGFYDHTS